MRLADRFRLPSLKQFVEPPFWETDLYRNTWLSSTSLLGDRESILEDFEGYIAGALKANGIVFACVVTRLLVFSEARFQWRSFQNGRPTDLFGDASLALLENPWPGGTTGELLARAEEDAFFAGNAYFTTVDDRGRAGNASVGGSGRRITRLRPDWVTMVIAAPSGNPNALDARVVGYEYKVPAVGGVAADPVLLVPSEVCHYAPLPDPAARFRGMSWLSPILRNVEADKAATAHKAAFFANGATPGIAAVLPPSVPPAEFAAFVAQFDAAHKGAGNAYKCLHPDTDVSMWDGRRVPARDVAAGDVVVAWDADRAVPGTVAAAEWQPPSPIVTVTTQRGRVIRTNDRHPFLVGERWVDAADLRPGDLLTTGLGWDDDEGLSDLTSHEAWLLGALTGDGSLTSTTPVVSAWDAGIRARFNEEHELRWTGKGHDYRILGVTKLVRGAGLTGKRSWEKRVPENVMAGPAHVRRAYLSGLIDTDGHVSDPAIRRTMEIGITSTSRDLLVDAQHLLATLGVNSSVSCSMPIRGSRTRDAWRLTAFGNGQAVRLSHVLDLASASKRDRLTRYAQTAPLNRRDSSRFDRVSAVEVADPEPTIGLEVDGYHTHVTGGVVTHNTLFLGGGADVTVLGRDFQQLDLKATQGTDETRVCMAARVHPTIVGASEGLAGSSLNAGNFSAAKRMFVDGTMRPLWRMFAASVQSLVTPPRTGASLWYDARDIAFLREDAKDAADIQQIEASTIARLIEAGFRPDAVVNAVTGGDLRRLQQSHSGLFSVQLQEPAAGVAQDPPAVANGNGNGNGQIPARTGS